ncbi:ribosomal RNA small subunit methyltransferase A [Treponema phagedenis]|uniref:Ribosomal RNA small subunit methyltransferase A n=1 Tax=Treponema phagedenis TaxID=162 RepID=A0A0B7GT92_TREPH|nr:16S rRNA (adenine(1518)-N(6)/adenine(1519)-N(6))-dimethyltransferase RsmA [Treponema phagedenis]QEJ94359.1 ribosomal RNA small subunit methyltransferase A [Treponema phagedenis]QEJ97337.1 ribosomal RNA small subunit methyltransferase A [Treponema phagedenis]QEK01723.1 ribosomal RNA small subunit methyltransferase A [Treponema phagedenis]QEK02469.1 ribosomal RNA small subunit methyltransferase A [Treponema phagedenis]QEK06840.1 ribosomal RNA small subunit methyltransferase A [Treponema phage
MNLPDYNSPSALASFLKERDLGMRKKFGQNFLIDENMRKFLIDSLELQGGERIWEIGPGLGAMTFLLLEKNVHTTAFEIDSGFSDFLRKAYGENPLFTLIEGDALKTWKAAFEKEKPDCFFGNLPYNIAAKLIADTIEAEAIFDKLLVTVQKEVGDRMRAQPNSPDYSSFSVLCNRYYDVTALRTIPSACFWPRPNVVSQALLLTKKTDLIDCKDNKLFFQLLRAFFSSRRKTLKNNFLAWQKSNPRYAAVDADTFFKKAEIDSSARAETLQVYDFLKLCDILTSLL